MEVVVPGDGGVVVGTELNAVAPLTKAVAATTAHGPLSVQSPAAPESNGRSHQFVCR
jgi:hypothetical protein